MQDIRKKVSMSLTPMTLTEYRDGGYPNPPPGEGNTNGYLFERCYGDDCITRFTTTNIFAAPMDKLKEAGLIE